MSTIDLAAGRATDAVVRSAARIDADGRNGIWIEVLSLAERLAAAARVDARLAAGASLPLAGLTLAVKGNIDVAGRRTTAGCPSYGELATVSAPVVVALEEAGAVVVGITNLDQFATGLVGTRSPHGVCPNAHWPDLVSGGSSSGSAVAVAAGLVDLSIGTDTAGSGRVPAAANGIVGVKPTRGWCPTVGVVPACRSLDCVSFFAADVETAALAARLAGAAIDDPADGWRRRPAWPTPAAAVRVGFPDVTALDFDGDASGPERCAQAFDQVRAALAARATPVRTSTFDVDPFVRTGALLYDGAFVAERYDAVGAFVDRGSSDLDPVVAGIISRAADLPAWRVFHDLDELARRRRATEPTWDDVDVIVVPSVPRVPTVADVEAEPIAVNSMLGTYTNFVNLLDLAAVTVPVHGSDDSGAGGVGLGAGAAALPPFSVTLIGPAWSDELLAALGAAITK